MTKQSIVMIHGMYAKGCCWDLMQDHFEKQGHKILTPTLPYHDVDPNEPPPPEVGTVSIEDYTDAMEREVVNFDPKAILIGHSMGAMIVQKLAERGLGSKLVCLSPAPVAGMITMTTGSLRYFFSTIRPWGFWRLPHKPTWEASKRAIFNAGIPEDEARRVYAQFVHESGRALFEIIMWYLDSHHTTRVDYRRIQIPALNVVGSADLLSTPGSVRRLASRFDNNGQYVELPGYGHWLLGESACKDVVQHINFFDAVSY